MQLKYYFSLFFFLLGMHFYNAFGYTSVYAEWTQHLYGTGSDKISHITTDKYGFAYIAGRTSSSSLNIDETSYSA